MRRRALMMAALACTACSHAPLRRAPSALPNVSVLPQPFTIPGLERQRTLRLYLPPGYAGSERRYPVIYMHDGQNLFDDATSYAGEWGADETLNAMAARSGFEAIVVGIDNGAGKRTNELNPFDHPRFGAGEGEQYLSFIVQVVKPYIDAHYRTQPQRESTAIFGSSLGGLISDYAMHRHPQVFGKAGVFSPSYWIAPAFWDYAAAHPLPRDAQVYLYAGGREGPEMVEGTLRRQAQLQAMGIACATRIAPDGEHNETTWRAEFPAAVAWLFSLRA
jgi:predicted alpha/beta superfamily hydrolase